MSIGDSCMKVIDWVFEPLQDLDWHDIEKIKKNNMPDATLAKVIRFLENHELIATNDKRLKITPKGLKFLELPC